MRVQRTIALVLGIASIACSSLIWVTLGLTHVARVSLGSMSGGTSLVLWAAAALLAALAARTGSRRWLLAALLPILNVVVLAALAHWSGQRLR